MRVSVAFAIGLGRYLSGFAEFIELRLKASTRLNHGRIIWMRRAACHARFGSTGEVAAGLRHDRFAPGNGHSAARFSRQFRAKAQSRCAPARCAGARAEMPVVDREDSNSGVARVNTIDSRRDRLLSMIKTSRSSPGQHLASHIERKPVCLNVPCIFWVARN